MVRRRPGIPVAGTRGLRAAGTAAPNVRCFGSGRFSLVQRSEPVDRPLRSVIAHVWSEAITDRAMLSAGGLAFFSMFGLLPAIAAIGAVYGLLISAETLEAQIASLGDVLPQTIVRMLGEFVSDVPRGFGLGFGLVFNLVIVMWTVQRSASGIITALNLTHSIEETRDRMTRQVAATAIAVASLFVIAAGLFLVAIVPLVAPLMEPALAWLVSVLRWVVAALLFLAYLWGVYRIAPAVPPSRYSWISIGAIVATGLWLIASVLFSLYVSNLGGFSSYYGSATGAVVLMTWLFITSWVVLIGAEVNEQLVEIHEGKPKNGLKDSVDRA